MKPISVSCATASVGGSTFVAVKESKKVEKRGDRER